jgi:hypothetical protein
MAAPIGQNNWRFCSKCYGLFFNGFDTSGVCPAGLGHQALASGPGPSTQPANQPGGPSSWDYILVANPVEIGGTE